MKKLLLLTMLIISPFAIAQLKVTNIEKPTEIGKVVLSGSFMAEITKQDGMYVFMYKDMNYSHIIELKYFKIKEADFDEVYKLFSEVGEAKEGETKMVELGTGDSLILGYAKSFGKLYVSIMHKDKSGVSGRVPGFTAKQLKKLFGKTD